MTTVLHERPARQLADLGRARLGSYLFYGPAGVGKATAAAELARRLACPKYHPDPGPGCAVCRQFATGAYPDFHYTAPADKPSITIEQIRSLTSALAVRPFHPQSPRTALIDDAHLLTVDAQNALLKLMEEPPDSTIIILVTSQPQQLLPTVRSRLAAVYFPPPPPDAIAAWLSEHNPGLTREQALKLATAAGTPGVAFAQATQADPAADVDLTASANTALSANIFDRLLLAAKLLDAKADLAAFSAQLQSQLTQAVLTATTTTAAAASSFETLERFRRRLAAKVNARVALECLMLELGR